MSQSWQKPTAPPPSQGPARAAASEKSAPTKTPSKPKGPPASPAAPRKDGDVLAYVDGEPILRQRVMDFLLRSHGAGVLEQIVVQDRAEREATQRGIKVTQRDIDAEHDRWLRRLTNPELAGVVAPEAPVDRAEGERLLERILSLRNISREEYMAGVRRNAYLRKIVEHDMTFADEQLAAEYRNAYGERVTARHIQLASAADAERVEQELASPGADFADLAKRHSANPDTASSGGLMKDFSREDEDVPALLRTVAFELAPGKHSNPVRIGEWFHIVKVDARHPASEADFASVRGELEARLRNRASEPAMQQLHQKLLDEAKVEITDPVLAEEYGKKHPRFAGGKK